MKYKIEHNLSDDEISDFAMLYRDHCEVRNQPFCMLYLFFEQLMFVSHQSFWQGYVVLKAILVRVLPFPSCIA